MVQQFFQSAVAHVCIREKAATDFIRFILHAHRGRHCHDNSCPILIFHDSLETFYNDRNNTWEEKNFAAIFIF